MYYSIKEVSTKLNARIKLLKNCILASKEFELGIMFVFYYCCCKNKYRKVLKKKIRDILLKYDFKYKDETLVPAKVLKNNYKIWIMWLQGKECMPETIQTCYKRVMKFSGDYQVDFISEKNLEKYITIPDVIMQKYKKGIIAQAQFADYVRVSLLKKYGGLWVDASLYCMHQIKNIENLTILTGKKEGVRKWTTFLMGTNEVNNKMFTLLKMCFENYWENYNVTIDYFLFDLFIEYLYENYPDVKEMLDSIDDNNTEIFTLLKLLSEPYDEIIYKHIKDTHTFQKLSQKKDYRKKKRGKKTFGEVLLRENVN